VFKDANKKEGIHKNGSIHLLRDSYVIHLFEGGTDIRYIQAFLKHDNLQTTMCYTQVNKLK
jgi:site-specific recombinase XerD